MMFPILPSYAGEDCQATNDFEVWRRDRGQCVQCGSTKNLHFDHDIPFCKGGSSLTAAAVRLLRAKHTLEMSDKIRSIAPRLFAGAAAAPRIQTLPAECDEADRGHITPVV